MLRTCDPTARDVPGPSVATLSTRATFRFFAGLIGVPMAGLLAIGVVAKVRGELSDPVGFAVPMAGLFGIAAVALAFVARSCGVYRTDDAGLTFAPVLGRPRSIAWDDVSAIDLSPKNLTVRADRPPPTSIVVGYAAAFDRRAAVAHRDATLAKLAERYDVTPSPRLPPIWRLVGGRNLAAYVVVFLLVSVAVPIGLAFAMKAGVVPKAVFRVAGVTAGPIATVAVFGHAFWLLVRERRRHAGRIGWRRPVQPVAAAATTAA